MAAVAEAELATLPAKPGVYMFRDREGRVIYVGKAKSLRSRVRSYFQNAAPADSRAAQLRKEIAGLEVTVCGSEVDALILESILIKKHKPRYNVILRDDKSYPYIAVTTGDEFPRVGLVRGRRKESVRYYGPYVSVRAAKSTLRLLHRVFPLRHCRGDEPGQKSGRPCLYYEMKSCLGPCNGKIEAAEYGMYVKSFCDFLEGRHQAVIDSLETEMHKAAENQEYERAARLRNQLHSAKRVLSHHRSISSSRYDYDVIGMCKDELEACFVVAQNRAGTHIGNLCFFTGPAVNGSKVELVTEFLKRYYDQASSIPGTIVVDGLPEEASTLTEWLTSERGRRVTIHVPKKGRKMNEMSLANANAELALEGAKAARARDRSRIDRALAEMANYLGLSKIPLRIECFDVSTMAGAASVGSMVVFQDGNLDRRSNRSFKIKFTSGVDDVGMMREILYRRFKRYEKETAERVKGRSGSGFERQPDLLILDGGRGQLGAALEVLKALRIDGVEVAALAKKLEEVYRPGVGDPIVLPRDSEALFLMQRIRDEAHRAAVRHHRSLMLRTTSSSWLDSVRGVGPERKKTLMEHFGSPAAVAEATLDELRSVRGIPEDVAHSVHEASLLMKEAGNGRRKH